MKGKGIVSPKKGEGVLLKKPMSKSTGKRKRSAKVGDKGPGPSPKLAKTSVTHGSSAKETIFQERHLYLLGKRKGCPGSQDWKF